MKLKIKETIIKEVEITLPTFMKSNCHYYKVVSETEVIQITDLSGHESIAKSYIESAFEKSNEPSNRKEFEDAFEKVLTILRKAL